jgi:phosphomannomutase
MPADAQADAPLMLSVSGMRGIVDQSLTSERVQQFAAAFGSFIADRLESAPDEAARKTRVSPHIILGRDSRPSGQHFADAAAKGLMAVGCTVTQLGVVMTPTAAVMVPHLHADGGIVITASHNPGQWNGVKMLNAFGAAPPKADADDVIARFNQSEPGSMNPREQAPQQNKTSNDIHLARVLAAIDAEPIFKRRFKVVVDSVCGAGGPAARMLLEALGCDIVHMHAEPTGQFPHPPEPTEANLTELARATKEHQADVGFAQDPDADRLAIIDETGAYIGEEYTLALASWRMLEMHAASTSRDRKGADSASGTNAAPVYLAANLSTSRMIDDIAARYHGVKVLRTPVGEANVVAAMQDHHAILGGEGNGGVILPQVCLTRDSLSAMALTLALMAARHDPLSAIVATLPRYVMIKQKFDFPTGSAAAPLRETLARVQQHFTTVPGARINTEDGLRIDLADSWVHLRGSNTEPIVRLIAEARSVHDAEALIATVARQADLH